MKDGDEEDDESIDKTININCFYTKKKDIFTGEHVQCNANERFVHLIS